MQTTVNQETLRGNRSSHQLPSAGDASTANAGVAKDQARNISKPVVENAGKNSSGNSLNGPQPHTPSQDLELFGRWVEKPIWVPPKDNSDELAKSMLNRFGPFASKEDCWKHVTRKHRDKFTQVRAIELPKASIRLPQGTLYVTVTEQDRFHEIEEEIPRCVQTRLDEFLAGPGQKRGVKVSYLKPLCVETGSDLIFTTQEELDEAIATIQAEVFASYKKQFPAHLMRQVVVNALDAALLIPRSLLSSFLERKKREVETRQGQLEFERRKRAHKAMRQLNRRTRKKCSFNEVLSLTDSPEREDVINQMIREKEVDRALAMANVERNMYLLASASALPWFAAMSLAAYKIAVASVTTAVTVSVCDPAFVAEMPGARGRLLKIGHFDEVDGVMHVEI
jgi:hypothetical protein